MSNNNIMINVKTQAEKASWSLKGLSDAFSSLDRKGKKTSKSLSSLSSGLGGIGKVISGIGIYNFTRSLVSATKAATDIVESVHLFNVSMGESAVETGKLLTNLSELSGMDKIKMFDTVGEYNILARSMGMVADKAKVLSIGTNQLALNLSSLTNRDVLKVSEDLRAGLIGQSRTVFKYGIDVTEASLKQEAYNLGIKKSVRNMTQSEKMALRYNIMIRQTGLAHQDFAKTIDSAANQLRILKERILTMTRTIGTMFLPVLEAILPYLNGFVILITKAASAMAKLMGYSGEGEQIQNTFSNFGADTGLEDVADDMDNIKKKSKELKSQLMGFDEINLYQDPKALDDGLNDLNDMDNKLDITLKDNSDSGLDGGSTQMAQKIADRVQRAFNNIKIKLDPLINTLKRLWAEGLSELFGFIGNDISNLYNSFIKPTLEWLFTNEDGIQRFINIINDMLKNIDWERLEKSLDRVYKALVPMAQFVFTALIDFAEHFLKPVGEWVFNNAIPMLSDALAGMLENIDWDTLNEGLVDLWKALADLTTLTGDALVWLVENALVPLGEWTMNELAPELIKTLKVALESLKDILEALKPTWEWAWENFFVPLANWTGDKILDFLRELQELLKWIAKWAQDNPKQFAGIISVVGALAGAFALLLPIFKFAGKMAKISTLMKVFGVSAGAASKAMLIAFGKIILIIVAVVAAIVLLVKAGTWIYKNWDTIKEKLKPITDFIGAMFQGMVEMIQSVIDNIFMPIFELIGETISDLIENHIRPMWDAFKDVLSSIGEAIGALLKNAILPLGKLFVFQFKFWIEVLSGFFHGVINLVVDILSNVFKMLIDIIKGVLNIIGGLLKIITGLFTLNLNEIRAGFEQIFQGILDFVAGILKGVANSFISVGNFLASMVGSIINMFIKGINFFSGLKIPDWVPIIGGNTLDFEKRQPININEFRLPLLAGGGLVDAGQLFIANEAGPEMVGQYGNKTGVVNNDQIVSSITEGVYRAVTSAIEATRVSGGNGTSEVVLQLDGREMGRALLPKLNGESKRLGYKPILNY